MKRSQAEFAHVQLNVQPEGCTNIHARVTVLQRRRHKAVRTNKRQMTPHTAQDGAAQHHQPLICRCQPYLTNSLTPLASKATSVRTPHVWSCRDVTPRR